MIPITKPVFDDSDLAIIQEPLKSGWIVQGRFVQEFEDLFCRFTGSRHSIATTSCTTALHIAMSALELEPGDEVIVPAFTWVATANAVEYIGARPVFVDISLETFNLEPRLLQERVTPRTRALAPVHLFGLVADMDAVMKLAADRNLRVVEDAACAFDSWYRDRHAGLFGDFGCFSFHPRKSITTGEGGMITTQSADAAAMCQSLRDHGATRTDFQRHTEQRSFLLAEYPHLGFNFRLTDIQGALGVTQMRKAKEIMNGRRAAAARYDALLAELSWLQLPFRHPDYAHGYQSYVCLFKPEEPSLANCDQLNEQRNNMMAILEKRGISTRQGTHAAAHTALYSSKYAIAPGDFPNAYIAERVSIALPLYSTMTEAEQVTVARALETAFEAVRKSPGPGAPSGCAS